MSFICSWSSIIRCGDPEKPGYKEDAVTYVIIFYVFVNFLNKICCRNLVAKRKTVLGVQQKFFLIKVRLDKISLSIKYTQIQKKTLQRLQLQPADITANQSIYG